MFHMCALVPNVFLHETGSIERFAFRDILALGALKTPRGYIFRTYNYKWDVAERPSHLTFFNFPKIETHI